MNMDHIFAMAGATPVTATAVGGHLAAKTTAKSPPPSALTAPERAVSLG